MKLLFFCCLFSQLLFAQDIYYSDKTTYSNGASERVYRTITIGDSVSIESFGKGSHQNQYWRVLETENRIADQGREDIVKCISLDGSAPILFFILYSKEDKDAEQIVALERTPVGQDDRETIFWLTKNNQILEGN